MNEELRIAIDSWLQKKGNSLLRLAKKSGLGYSTVRRIVQNEQIPSIKTQLMVGTVVLDPEKCMELFKDQIPGIFIVGGGRTKNGVETRDELLSGPVSHGIISLAVRGTTREEIQTEFGRRGVEELERLMDSGVLAIKNEQIFSENIDISAVGDICKTVQLSAEQYTPENFVSGCWWSEGWNPQGIVELANACTEFTTKVAVLAKNEKFRGSLSATVGMYMFRRGNKWL